MVNKTQDKKNIIIESLKNSLKENTETFPLPDLSTMSPGTELSREDLLIHFEKSLKSVGGELIRATDLNAAKTEIEKIHNRPGLKIASMVPGLSMSTFDVASITDPHELNGLDLAILPGRLAIAENGAIWVNGEDLSHRALIAIPESLVLVFKQSDLIFNMHKAYSLLSFKGASFGAFISGPSKTADIEQSLVIGAQGARSMQAIVILS